MNRLSDELLQIYKETAFTLTGSDRRAFHLNPKLHAHKNNSNILKIKKNIRFSCDIMTSPKR
ncbi:MAG: hypothetical protein GY861_28615 [bacterium]|nr:hypothetical protein [bacterium]